MSRGKKKPAPVEPTGPVESEEMNTLMSTYRGSILSKPVILWRKNAATVVGWELSDEEFDYIIDYLDRRP